MSHRASVVISITITVVNLIVRAILEDNGYRVIDAADGPEATAMVAEKHYGVILMDIKMPGIDGFAALEKIRQLDAKVKTVFIRDYISEDSGK